MADQSNLQVRVAPRSSRDEVSGWRDDVLLVRLKAPPVEGQANERLCRLLARRLGLPLVDVVLVSGATSRNKLLRIQGLSETEVRERLAQIQ